MGATGWAGLWLHAAVATGLGGLYMAGSGLWFRALGRAVAEVGVRPAANAALAWLRVVLRTFDRSVSGESLFLPRGGGGEG